MRDLHTHEKAEFIFIDFGLPCFAHPGSCSFDVADSVAHSCQNAIVGYTLVYQLRKHKIALKKIKLKMKYDRIRSSWVEGQIQLIYT